MLARLATVARFAAVFLPPSLVFADALAAGLRGWRPSSPVVLVILAVAGLLTGLGALALVVPAAKARIQRHSTALVCVSLSVTAALAASEVLLRSREPVFHLRPPNLQIVCKTEPGVMPGISGETRSTFNSRGIRGAEFPEARDVYRILCVGGSTTECYYLDDSQCWPNLVMDAFPGELWVGSTGISGYATRDHLRFLRGSSLIDEVDCVVLLVGYNDLIHSLAPHPPIAPYWARSAVAVFVGKMLRGDRPDIRVEDRAGRMYVLRRTIRKRAVKVAELPDLSAALDEYSRLTAEIITTLRRRGVRPIFMTQPVLYRDDLSPEEEDLLWMGSLPGGRYLTAGAMRRAIDLYNRRLLDTCRDLGVECIDLAELHGRTELYYDDCHYNVAGSRAVADLLIDHLDRPRSTPLAASSPR